MASFLISSMVLGLLDELQIFWQLYLMKLLGIFNSLGLLELYHLIYPRLLTGFGILVFLTNLIFMKLFCLFLLIDSFVWFWMGSLCKNIQLMVEFLKALFLVLDFSCSVVMTFLMILSVIFLSTLVMLLVTVSVIRHLICGND